MLRAYIGTVVVIVVPGLLVASILGLRMRELLTWAAIPALSIATVFLLGEATMLLGVPFGLPTFTLLLAVMGGVAVMRPRHMELSRMPENRRRESRGPVKTRLGERIEHVLLALSIAVGGSTWFRGLRGVPLIPPGADATLHGWFVARILSGQTIEPSKVLTSDIGGTHHIVNYYPLALHASAALSTRLAGSDVGRVLVAYIVVFSAVVLPVGMFVLARTLAPDQPLVAGFTALVVPMMMLFPYYPIASGDLPQVVAMAMVPATIVLVRHALLVQHPRVQTKRAFVGTMLPSAMAILCTTALHASELPLIAFLTMLLILEHAWREHNVRALQTAFGHGVMVGALATVLFAPTLVSFVRGVFERAQVRNLVGQYVMGWEPALGAILQLHWGAGTVRQGFLALLALAGAALWLMRRRPAWVAGWVGVVLLAVLANASTNRLANHLTFPWYHLDWRIVPNVAFFVPFFAGLALAYGALLITRVARRPRAILPASLAMIAFLAQFVGVRSFFADSAYVGTRFDPDAAIFGNQAFVADSALRAFEWLHVHASRGDTVANEPSVDGSLWMYAQKNVAPLVGPYNYNLDIGNTPPELTDRLYLTQHLQSLGSNPRVDDLARRYHTRWVFFDTHALLLRHRSMNLAALQGNPRLTAVFHQGSTWVFRIDLSKQ